MDDFTLEESRPVHEMQDQYVSLGNISMPTRCQDQGYVGGKSEQVVLINLAGQITRRVMLSLLAVTTGLALESRKLVWQETIIIFSSQTPKGVFTR